MMRFFAFSFSLFLAASLLAEEDLPQDPGEPLDIEPPMLIQEIPSRNPGPSAIAPQLDPEQIALALEKARKSAAAGERLFRSGVIAKVESENRILKVVRLEADLAKARLELAKENMEAQQSRFDATEIPQSELEKARFAVGLATTEAAAATAQREKAELEAALLNLRRQKKLLAMGSGRKAEVSRAEEKVAALQQQKN
jgi:hypothetical protein